MGQIINANQARAEVQKIEGQLGKVGDKLGAALAGTGVSVERFTRSAINAISSNKDLLTCDRASLFASIVQIAQAGLEIGPHFGHASLVPFKGKVQPIIEYKGKIHQILGSGKVSKVELRAVFEGDEFEYEYGTAPKIVHKCRDKSRELTHVYAVAFFGDGSVQFDVMTKADVDEIRNKAPGKNAPAWVNHYAEQAKKTICHRISKVLPKKGADVVNEIELGQAPESAVNLDEWGVEVEEPTRQALPEPTPSFDRDGVVDEGEYGWDMASTDDAA